MRKLLLWLVMVAAMVAAILGGTAAFLYSRTGKDALPQEAVTFGEIELEPNGWSWVIPVLGDKVSKTYECLAPCRPTTRPRYGTVERLDPPAVFPLRRRSHITKLRGVLQAFEEPQAVNAETVIDLAAGGYPSMGGRLCHGRNGLRAYELVTGKTHQLRVHMNSIGLPIHGDDFYPRIVERAYDDFSTPLELVARSLRFTDPVSGEPREFISRIPLGW